MAQQAERVGFDREFDSERTLWHLRCGSVDEFVTVELPARPFVCLLAWDAADESVATIGAVVDALLDAGCACLCTYGQNCELVHDICDEEVVIRRIDDPPQPFVMTTWHTNAAPEEVLYFFLACTPITDVPRDDSDEPWGAPCRDAIVVEIGKPAFDREWLHLALRDSRRFRDGYEERP